MPKLYSMIGSEKLPKNKEVEGGCSKRLKSLYYNEAISEFCNIEVVLDREKLANIRKEIEKEFGPENYELRGDNGDYTPSKDEKFLMFDMLTGLLDEFENALITRQNEFLRLEISK